MAYPIEARVYLQNTRYRPTAQVAVALGATEHDVSFTLRSEFAYRNPTVAPMVTLNWLTSYGVEPLAGEVDFRIGFRVIFGAPAPAGAVLNWAAPIEDFAE